jgi:hypothetical protein
MWIGATLVLVCYAALIVAGAWLLPYDEDDRGRR